MVNDTTLHFMACFLITVVVFVFLYWRERPMESKEIFVNWLAKVIIVDSVNKLIKGSIIISVTIGGMKEIWDIWYSDPELSDFVADVGGALFAGILIWLIGMKWVECRFR